MTENDFDVLLNTIKVSFPAVWHWLNGLFNSDDTIRAWFDALEDCELTDCLDAIKSMMKGDVEMPAAYERERIPAAIRIHCKKLRSERKRAEQVQSISEAATKRGKCQPIGPWIRQAMELGGQLRDGSMTQEAHDAEMASILKKLGSDPNAWEPRYSCPLCLDQTRVCIWHPDEVSKARRSGKPPRRISAVIACQCNTQPDSGPKYDDAIHYKIRHSVPSMDDGQKLMDWIEAQGPQRHSEFDEYSGGDFWP